MSEQHQAGFVSIFGLPNAGKSTLMNALLGEQLAITSPKVQTTRHRIAGIMTEPGYQIVFSDTPGVIEPRYGLHRKMMQYVKSALEDADVAILVHDITQPLDSLTTLADSLKLKVPVILLLNKADLLKTEAAARDLVKQCRDLFPSWDVLAVSARKQAQTEQVVPLVLRHLPEAPPYYPDDNISDRPVRFFVSELIREQIYHLFHEEIPYHAAVMIQSFEEKPGLTVIKAEIVVARDTQKVILIGTKGSMIKQIGINARKKIEEFLQAKVHLELFVKVRPKWRDNENYLREYGYNG